MCRYVLFTRTPSRFCMTSDSDQSCYTTPRGRPCEKAATVSLRLGTHKKKNDFVTTKKDNSCSTSLPAPSRAASTSYSHSRDQPNIATLLLSKWTLQPNNVSQTPSSLDNNKRQIIIETVSDLWQFSPYVTFSKTKSTLFVVTNCDLHIFFMFFSK